ncbi:hypothetical protein [Rhizobium hidalgonense]|uniref:ATP-binding protein n=1 Tax=Rhizobium hidalgonense TaxID=1538159 RepID=A0ABX4JQE2_9HYPH|nr:hypothetical protein [Rhizobium hidalgonense]PDT21811.1 hypothetical protein CO674_19880 [Rhizobium hidalgonense]PON08467.1 hypothetical protein ATY29_05580 [Rhizobium hidalgonense]
MHNSQGVSLRPERDQTRSTSVADRFDRQDASPFGLRRVLATVINDLYGTKDVQDAITASYVWMADQIGHLALGLVPTLLLCWFVSGLGIDDQQGEMALYVVAGLAVFLVWYRKEEVDRHDSKARAGGTFPYDSGDIDWNITTALIYFGIGGLLGLAAFIRWWLPLVVLAAVLYPALAVAFWWLQRKLSFQQAGLPYLFRLANFARPLECELIKLVTELSDLKDRRVTLLDVLRFRPTEQKGSPATRHVVITGSIGAGKTSLCVGIGTEYAFALNRCRYLSATKLVEQVLDPPVRGGGREYADGRYLWALDSCEMVLVDDVDVGIGSREGEHRHLIEPIDMLNTLVRTNEPSPLGWLGSKRSVWVVGDPRAAEDWREMIAQLIGVTTHDVGIVWLGGKISKTEPKQDAPGVLVI